MIISVANKRTFRPDGTTAIYRGRPSPLGNPYKVGPAYPGMAAIEAYAAWLDEQLADPASGAARMFASLLRIARRGDLTLICWCKQPDREVPCHGDVIKARLEAALRGEEG